MALPLMPKATAVWLVENTTLSFVQIAEFCGMHQLEIQAIADDEVAVGMRGLDPISNAQLTPEELDRCQADADARLELAKPKTPVPKARSKGARYTPVSKRQDRPDAIAWLVKNYPELSDAQISRLIGTTKQTINAVRDKTHWNTQNIKPQSPVGLGLCSEEELEKVIAVARARAGIVHTPTSAEDAEDVTMIITASAAALIPSSLESVPAVDETAAQLTAENVFASTDALAAAASTSDEPADQAVTAESVFGPSPDRPATVEPSGEPSGEPGGEATTDTDEGEPSPPPGSGEVGASPSADTGEGETTS